MGRVRELLIGEYPIVIESIEAIGEVTIAEQIFTNEPQLFVGELLLLREADADDDAGHHL